MLRGCANFVTNNTKTAVTPKPIQNNYSIIITTPFLASKFFLTEVTLEVLLEVTRAFNFTRVWSRRSQNRKESRLILRARMTGIVHITVTYSPVS
jgi:hypothetical protein